MLTKEKVEVNLKVAPMDTMNDGVMVPISQSAAAPIVVAPVATAIV